MTAHRQRLTQALAERVGEVAGVGEVPHGGEAHQPESVPELARLVDRDIKTVSTTLTRPSELPER